MNDIGYVLSLAFSGSDLPRALWLGLIASLFCSTRCSPTHMVVLIFCIDRLWPFGDMALSGYGFAEIAAAFSYMIQTLPVDALSLTIRAIGLYMLISIGYWARLALHGHRPQLKPAKINLPY